jgi:hypothetical protein
LCRQQHQISFRNGYFYKEEKPMKTKTTLLKIVLLSAFLFAFFPAVASAQEEGVTCDHPRVIYLAEKTGASCQEIVDLHNSGVGFGRIMKAAVLAERLPEGGPGWRELLQAHLDGMGWGQINQLYGMHGRFGDLGLSPEQLLALRESGLGWGQIVHAQALANAGIGLTFEQAVEMLQSGMGWGEIRDQLGLEKGPPPWAGQGKNKANGNNNGQGIGNGRGNGNGHGPPPWAGQGNGNGHGRPPWAGQGNGNSQENVEE